MAKLGARRYDGKLDSFLHRNLPREEYERICTSEPCVVVSPEEKRVHKHAILGHRCLYLADFPPKNVKVAVHLQDIETVRLLDDLPEFLSGKEQEETVHVQILYRRITREKSLLTTISEKSPAILRKAIAKKTERRTSSPLLSRSLSHQVSPETYSSSPRGSMLSLTSSFAHSTQSPSPSITKRSQQQRSWSLSPVSYEDVSTSARILDHPLHRSLPPAPTTRHSDMATHLPNGVTSSPSLKWAKDFSSPSGARRMRPAREHPSSTNLKSVASAGLTSSTSSISSTFSSPGISKKSTLRSKSRSMQHHSSSPDISSSTLSLGSSSLSLASLSATEKLSLLDSSDPDVRSETAVLDLYVLKQTTDFYHQLCTTWKDFCISHILEQSDSCPSKASNTSLPHDHFSQHYCALKQQLLSAKSIETSAQLAQELCTACQKYFVIKKMFWEDCELFGFCIEQLKSYLSPKGRRRKSSRADEVELSLIAMDLLLQMLRETHVLPKRLLLLTRNSGQLLLSLATTVVHLLPEHKSNDTQIHTFDEELTEKACGILFELIRVTQQARWPPARTSTVSTSWLVEVLAALPSIKDFCARPVAYASSVLTSSVEAAEPKELVTLHYIAFVMSTLVNNSTALAQLFHTHFAEEFRYYISISRAKQKLPESDPLSKSTLELLHSAKSKVLHVQA